MTIYSTHNMMLNSHNNEVSIWGNKNQSPRCKDDPRSGCGARGPPAAPAITRGKPAHHSYVAFLSLCRQLEHPCAKSLFQVRKPFGSEQV